MTSPFATSPMYSIRLGVFTTVIPETVAESTRVSDVTPASDCPRNDLEPAGPSAIALAVDPCVSTSRFRADEASLPGDSNVKMKSFVPDSPEPVTCCRINSPFSDTKMPLAESTYRVPVVS
jgi:hypothetical protein